MSKQTMTKIEATAALASAIAAAIAEAQKAGLSAGDVQRVLDPITELLGKDE